MKILTTSQRSKDLDMMANQLDGDDYGYGFASAALREYANLIRAGIPNDLAEKVKQEKTKLFNK